MGFTAGPEGVPKVGRVPDEGITTPHPALTRR